MDNTSLSGWRLLRSMIPPWGNRLNDPLLHFEVRPQKRTGGTPLGFLIVLALVAVGLTAYLLVVNFLTRDHISARQQVEETMFILMLGLVSMSILGHWRLLLVTLGRSSAAIAQKRERGDWELIYITPVSKARWFRAQFTALGWQIFPLVRRVMIVHFTIVMIAIPRLVILQNEEHGHASTLLYAVELLPFATLVIMEPILSAGMFISSSLVESSLRNRTWVAFLSGLGAVYLTRLAMALVLLAGSFVILVGVAEAAAAVGLEEGGSGIDDLSGDEVLVILFYGGISALATAFIIEWIPPGAAILMASAYDTTENILVFTWLMLTFILAYVITPPILMRLLARRSVRRLNRPPN